MYLLPMEGVVDTTFFALKNVEHADATGIRRTLEKAFDDAGIINWQDKLVGFLTDGAAVNLGQKKGVAAQLKQGSPWLVAIHCFNHRLELAMKDAFNNTYVEDVNEMLMRIYYVYRNSTKRLRELKALAEIMEEQIKLPQRAHGTRWVQHKNRAIKALIQSYPTIVGHLENLATDTTKTSPADRAKMKGYLNTLKSVKFVLHVLYMDFILEPLSKLSLNLQKESVDLLCAKCLLEVLYKTLDKQVDSEEMKNIISAVSNANNTPDSDSDDEPAQPVTYQGVKLTYLQRRGRQTVTDIANFKEQARKYNENISKSLKLRFGDLDKEGVFEGLQLLDIDQWPSSTESLNDFGNNALEAVTKHFKVLLGKNVVHLPSISGEWQELKILRQNNLKTLTRHEFWKCIGTRFSDEFSNFLHLIKILQVLPQSNAKVERSFSSMGRIKTDHRNRLSEQTLDSLMRISIEGPKAEDYNSRKAVEHFFAAKLLKATQHPAIQSTCIWVRDE